MTIDETSQHLRMLEALLFAAAEPLDEASLAARLPDGADVPALLQELSRHYENRGVTLTRTAGKWQLRTAEDLRFLLELERQETRRLSRAALETLAIVAYQQPVTRAEIEEIRGVAVSKGTLDLLIEVGWVRIRGRRRVPGRPVTYGTTDAFLEHFGMDSVQDLPGLEELKAAGLLESMPPPSFLPRAGGEDEEDPEDPDDHDAAEAGLDALLEPDDADETDDAGEPGDEELRERRDASGE